MVFYGDTNSDGANELYSACRLKFEELHPRSGSPSGGTTVLLNGFGFTPTTRVEFGGRSAESVRRIDGSTLQVVTPAHPRAGGPSDSAGATPTVSVSIFDGNARVTLPDAFTYRPDAPAAEFRSRPRRR